MNTYEEKKNALTNMKNAHPMRMNFSSTNPGTPRARIKMKLKSSKIETHTVVIHSMLNGILFSNVLTLYCAFFVLFFVHPIFLYLFAHNRITH